MKNPTSQQRAADSAQTTPPAAAEAAHTHMHGPMPVRITLRGHADPEWVVVENKTQGYTARCKVSDLKLIAAHTPTPWTVMPLAGGNHGLINIRGCDGRAVALTAAILVEKEQNEANAAFIVRACNSHAANLTALENAANGFALLAANLRRQSEDAKFGSWFKSAAAMADSGEQQARAVLNAAKEGQ